MSSKGYCFIPLGDSSFFPDRSTKPVIFRTDIPFNLSMAYVRSFETNSRSQSTF